MVINTINEEMSFCDYYSQWVDVYKEGAIREVTMKKYKLTQAWLRKLIPDLKLSEFDRVSYQKLINGYAEHHEHQTTMDFHHQLKGAILDAVDEGLIQRDPTRKAIIKGKQPRQKKTKYLNQFELHAVLADLKLDPIPNWDWLILLVAKTGLRFSEALGLTPDDFDFVHQTLSVNKTWNYKNGGGFVPTKNASSVRKVQLDWQLIMQLSVLLKNLPDDKPIFVNGKVYNSTANGILARHCKQAGVPVISIHGLRHTHASLLLFAGVSIASVSKRLGHASMNTTQETYLHVIRELENKESDLPLTISAQHGLIDQRLFFNAQVASRDMSGYYLLRQGEFAYNKSTSADSPWGAIKRLTRYEKGCVSTLYICFALLNANPDYLVTYYETNRWHKAVQMIAAEGARNHGLLNIAPDDFFDTMVSLPESQAEQQTIGAFFSRLDSLITLHQRKRLWFAK